MEKPAVDSPAFYQTLVEHASEGMLTIDDESQIVYANPAVEKILGYKPSELIGSSKMKIIPERLRPIHAAALEKYVQTGEKHIDWNGVELPALHKDGHEVPTLISFREHELNGEQYFTGIIRDITTRQQREQQLHTQNEHLDDFAELLAHDIRNPLSVAQGYTEVAQHEQDIPALAEVAEALDRIETLVDDVLALSKAGQAIGEVEQVTVIERVNQAWHHVETPQATLQITSELGSIIADQSRFQELLENLFRNAIEHTDGPVTVRVGRFDDGNGLYVADDGPGIPREIRGEIFEHGYSTREAGTGYGLAIVKQIADAHGWTLSVTASDDGGARFEITGLQDDTPNQL